MCHPGLCSLFPSDSSDCFNILWFLICKCDKKGQQTAPCLANKWYTYHDKQYYLSLMYSSGKHVNPTSLMGVRPASILVPILLRSGCHKVRQA